jgi:hypothetical protein
MGLKELNRKFTQIVANLWRDSSQKADQIFGKDSQDGQDEEGCSVGLME